MSVNRLVFVPVPAALRALVNPFRGGARAEERVPDEGIRIGELSRRSGVPVGSIKYYLREGLLAPGRATGRTQARYGLEHLRALRVIGVLGDVGGLSIAQIGRVMALLDRADPEPRDLALAVAYALPSTGRRVARRLSADQADGAGQDDGRTADRAATDAFIDGLGLVVDDASPARDDLADAYAALRSVGLAEDPVVFLEHARLAYELAELEIDSAAAADDPAATVEAVTVGSVVFGAAFLALRRLAHEHETRRLAEGTAGELTVPLAQGSVSVEG